MSSQGWISIHRKIQECFLWDSNEPFDRRSAWIDLLLLANHEEKKTMFNGNPITIKRGQRITSIRTLAERWSWSTKKTLSFLKLLESEGMIERESDNKKTLLTIVNYEVYQSVGNTEETQKKQKRTTKETQELHSLPTNNNDNNDNKDIDIGGKTEPKKSSIIPPKIEWIEEYCKERGNNVDAHKFFDFYESKGWQVGSDKMKNWQACVRTWERNQKEKEPKKEIQKSKYNFAEMQKFVEDN